MGRMPVLQPVGRTYIACDAYAPCGPGATPPPLAHSLPPSSTLSFTFHFFSFLLALSVGRTDIACAAYGTEMVQVTTLRRTLSVFSLIQTC